MVHASLPFHSSSLKLSPLLIPNFFQQIKSSFPTIHRKNKTELRFYFDLFISLLRSSKIKEIKNIFTKIPPSFRRPISPLYQSHNEKETREKSGYGSPGYGIPVRGRGEINISPLSRSIAVTRAILLDWRLFLLDISNGGTAFWSSCDAAECSHTPLESRYETRGLFSLRQKGRRQPHQPFYEVSRFIAGARARRKSVRSKLRGRNWA